MSGLDYYKATPTPSLNSLFHQSITISRTFEVWEVAIYVEEKQSWMGVENTTLFSWIGTIQDGNLIADGLVDTSRHHLLGASLTDE